MNIEELYEGELTDEKLEQLADMTEHHYFLLEELREQEIMKEYR